MKFTTKQYAQALYDAVHETAAKDHELVLNNFVKVLAQSGDLAKYDEIEKEYKLLDMKAQGITEAKVTVAREMEVNSVLMNQLNQVVGNKVEIKKQVDEGIVGGVIVRLDDTLIDASIKTQLKHLNSELKS